jgi:hypothetical protein
MCRWLHEQATPSSYNNLGLNYQIKIYIRICMTKFLAVGAADQHS